jgi:hypothetical protein
MRFPDEERRLLLGQPGIGPTVIARLEAAGIDSLRALRCAGARVVVEAVCAGLGTGAWTNRRKALEKALQRLA